MSLDLVVQHELQCRTSDFVVIDNEHTPLIDGFCCFDTDLHVALVQNSRVMSGRAAQRATSNFYSAPLATGVER
jgi:hypothetical protein